MAQLLVVTCVAAGGAVGWHTPAQAASVRHTYLQFNMCGGVCNGGGLAVANEIINFVNSASPQPLVITLNEVCRTQYSHLYGRLAPYYGRFDTTVPGLCPGGVDYGNAILLRTSNFTYLGTWLLPEPGANREDREIFCLRTTVTGGGTQPLVACVTHTDPASDTYPAQIRRISSVVEPYWSGNHVMVGGDFNVHPGSSHMNPMYSSEYHPPGDGIFNETDRPATSYSRTTFSTTANEFTHDGLAKKLDYIFLSRLDYTSFTGDATNSSYSDHDPLWAFVTYV